MTDLERIIADLRADALRGDKFGWGGRMNHYADRLAALAGAAPVDTGNLVSDPLYLALDALYERGWVEHYKGRKFDPRGTIQWQAVLDIFRQHGGSKSVRVYFRRHGSATEDHVDVVGNPTDHVSVSLITRVEPTPPSTAPHAPAKAREVTEADVERALGALNRRIIDGRQFWSEEDRTLMRAALATFAEGAE